jgi:hypothetical protein
LPAGLARYPNDSDYLPLVWPTGISERLAKLLSETDHCTSKHILFIDTMPAVHPLNVGENLHYAISSSNPDESYILLDTASAHETTFAHEIAHLWLNYVQYGGDGMRRLREEAWDNTKYMQLNFVQSFVVDLKVNDLIAERGFDMSLITADEINGLLSLRDAIAIGYQPPAPRAALMHSITIADAILDQKRWPNEDRQRLVGLLEFFEAAIPPVYRMAQELVEIVRRNGYESREAIRKTLDECITLAFRATGDDFDIERDLEEAPLVEGMKDKYPHEFSGYPVPLKIEISKTLVRHGIIHRLNSGGYNIVLSADTNGLAQINVEIDNGDKLGPLPVNFQLIPLALLYAQEFEHPVLESSHHNGRMDQHGRLPGHPSFNSATPPERDPFDDMFAHLQVPLPGNDTLGRNPVLYYGRMPDQYGRLPGHPHDHWPTGPDQDSLNGSYPDHLQVPASELKKLAQTWREETTHKEMAARAERQLKARPQFMPVSFRVNPELPHKEVRTLPPPVEIVEERSLAQFYMAGLGLMFSNAALDYQTQQNAMRSNLYQYAYNNPVNFVDPSGNAPILTNSFSINASASSGTHPCEQRTLQYCISALRTGNPAEACFCNVSAVLCQTIIKNDSIKYSQRVFVDCLNKCMYLHWLNKDTPTWQAAKKKCDCNSYIQAEQTGLTSCLTTCAPVDWPPALTQGFGPLLGFPFNGTQAQRIAAGQSLCCNGGFPGAPASGDFPAPWDDAQQAVPQSQRNRGCCS